MKGIGLDQCIHILLEHGADTRITDNEGLTAAMLAKKCGNYQCADLLNDRTENQLITASSPQHKITVEAVIHKENGTAVNRTAQRPSSEDIPPPPNSAPPRFPNFGIMPRPQGQGQDNLNSEVIRGGGSSSSDTSVSTLSQPQNGYIAGDSTSSSGMAHAVHVEGRSDIFAQPRKVSILSATGEEIPPGLDDYANAIVKLDRELALRDVEMQGHSSQDKDSKKGQGRLMADSGQGQNNVGHIRDTTSPQRQMHPDVKPLHIAWPPPPSSPPPTSSPESPPSPPLPSSPPPPYSPVKTVVSTLPGPAPLPPPPPPPPPPPAPATPAGMETSVKAVRPSKFDEPLQPSSGHSRGSSSSSAENLIAELKASSGIMGLRRTRRLAELDSQRSGGVSSKDEPEGGSSSIVLGRPVTKTVFISPSTSSSRSASPVNTKPKPNKLQLGAMEHFEKQPPGDDNTKAKTGQPGSFKPEDFLDQVAHSDKEGKEIPPWKRQVLAKQMADKANAGQLLKKDNSKLENLPQWKRALVEKKEAMAAKEREEKERQRQKEVENEAEIVEKLAPWQQELRMKRN